MSNIDSRKRNWCLEINNPKDKHMGHEEIKNILHELGEVKYFCMKDEIGSNETYHTHIYVIYKNAIRFSSIRKYSFDDIQPQHAKDNNDCKKYVLKEGPKYNKDEQGNYSYIDSNGKEHKGISYDDTFEEFGELPNNISQKDNKSALINKLIFDEDMKPYEIINQYPDLTNSIKNIEYVYNLKINNELKNNKKRINLEVTLIIGSTGTGKTSFVWDHFSNCYFVTDYDNPFDSYELQEVICLDDFRGDIKYNYLLKILDNYRPLELKCRFYNKYANFNKIFITTNDDLHVCYKEISSESLKALYRRFTCGVIQMNENKNVWFPKYEDYLNPHCKGVSIDEYIKRYCKDE